MAAAIRYALHGSLSKEFVPAVADVDAVLDPAERMALVALRYAHLVKPHLKGEQLSRYTGALRHVQAALVDDSVTRAEREVLAGEGLRDGEERVCQKAARCRQLSQTSSST